MLRPLLCSLGALALVLVACSSGNTGSGATTSPGGSSSGSSGSSGASSGSSANPEGGSPGGSSSGSSGSSGAPDGGSSSDAAPPPVYTSISATVTTKADLPGSLYPLAAGLRWTYTIHPGTTTCTGGPRTIQVRTKTSSGGSDLYTVDTPCDYFADGADNVTVTGDAVYSQVATGARSEALAPPLADGASWAENSIVTGAWKREPGPITVAAGTFHDCWTVHSTPYESFSTFCRGIGVVRTTSTTGGGGTGFGMELTSYDFSALP